MLSTDDLVAMRETFAMSLPDTCTLVLDTLVSDGGGGHSVQAPVSPPTVACRVSPLTDTVRNAELAAANRVIPEAPWTITVPTGTVVTEEHRIRVGGREFEVAAVLGPRSYDVGMRLVCRLINSGAG